MTGQDGPVGGQERARGAARALGRGLATAGRWLGRGTREGTTRFHTFASADGADLSGLSRLTELHAVTAAADAAFTVSLATTVLALPVGQARGHVALFLLTTMAPFVVLAPFIGPLLDRFRHGRRWAIGGTLALRAFLSWVLAGLVTSGSAWLLPVALVCLLAARAYVVARAAATPLVLPEGLSLVRANSRQSIAALVGMAVGSLLAAPIGRIGEEWSLRVAFLLYVVATIQAIRLPAQVDSAPPTTGTDIPSRAGDWRFFARGPRPHLTAAVRATLAACTGSRLLAGFLTVYVAFLLREQPLEGMSSVLSLGLVVTAAGLGNAAGSFLGNRLGSHAPSRVAIIALLTATGVAAVTTLFYSAGTLIVLGLVTGAFGQLTRLCLDALVQRDTDEHVRARVFSGLETRLQLAWVVGGGVGIVMPLTPWFAFAVMTALLAAMVFSVIYVRRAEKRPWPTREVK